jgi:hypothetical protein
MSNSKFAQSKTDFPKRTSKNGKPNPKYVDLLDVDKTIANQNFGCFSFITPEKILKQKEMFYFEKFLKKWEFKKSMEKFTQFVNFVSFKYKISLEDVMKDYEEFTRDEQVELMKTDVDSEYKTFIDQSEEKLENEFNIQHNFQTSVRGFKFRGAYPTQEEAELRCKMLRELDPSFDIFVGPVGQWLCWDPEAYKTGRTEYMEEELNQLMTEKVKNESFAKSAFEQRVKETKQKAIEDNIKNSEKSGSTLTQGIDEDGNLVGVNNANTQESSLSTNDIISVADIRQELFEGENVVIGKTDYGQSQLSKNED